MYTPLNDYIQDNTIPGSRTRTLEVLTMKWKDSGDMSNNEEEEKEEFFDEEQYSPWADGKENKKGGKLGKMPLLFFLLAGAIVALVAALLMLILNGNGDAVNTQKIAQLERQLQQYEERLSKYEAIDEKVTRIWEQAKSFEKFKDRFDRSEASMSLRMDHLTMSLEALQKQLTESKTEAQTPVASKTDAGDSPKPTSKIIDEWVDVYAFLDKELG